MNLSFDPKTSLLVSPLRWGLFAVLLSVICTVLFFLPTGQVPNEALEGQGLWFSMLPPIIAVLISIIFRSLIAALSMAFISGAILNYGYNPGVFVPQSVNNYLISNIFGQFSLYIFGFLFSLVGMVHVLYKCGGIQGLVLLITRFAKTPRSVQGASMLSGLVIFFDDYSNTVVVGQTMKSLTDKWRVSREKLAYIVDSTTAPIAGVALVSTWIAYEVWLLGSTANSLGIETDGYSIFVQMLPMRFYCWGTLIFVALIILTRHDFGPMLKAEARARRSGKVIAHDAKPLLRENPKRLEPPENIPFRWYNAAIPVLVVLCSFAIGIAYVGSTRLLRGGTEVDFSSLSGLREIFGIVVYDPSLPQGGPGVPMILFWAAIAGSAVAMLLPIAQRILTLKQTFSSYIGAVPTLAVTLFILPMAWAMKSICEELGTSYYLISLLGDALPLGFIPFITFILGAGMAFAMGTSWGTMGVMIPIMLPFAWTLGEGNPDQFFVFILTSAAVLDGAIFGDHCSPISDTTVLSSVSTGCDHLHHVSTQLPYALTTMFLAGLPGYVGTSILRLPIWTYYPFFALAGFVIIITFGKRPSRAMVAN